MAGPNDPAPMVGNASPLWVVFSHGSTNAKGMPEHSLAGLFDAIRGVKYLMTTCNEGDECDGNKVLFKIGKPEGIRSDGRFYNTL